MSQQHRTSIILRGGATTTQPKTVAHALGDDGRMYCWWLGCVIALAFLLRIIGFLPRSGASELIWNGVSLVVLGASWWGLQQSAWRRFSLIFLLFWHCLTIAVLSFPSNREVEHLLAVTQVPTEGPGQSWSGIPVAHLELAWVALLTLLLPVLLRLPLAWHIVLAVFSSQCFILAMAVRWSLQLPLPPSSFIYRTEIHQVLVGAAAVVLAVLLDRQRRQMVELQEQVTDLGSYRLGEQLGAGGMGAVYEATHRMLQRDVAVKLVQDTGDDERGRTARERLLREARAAARLSSPNSVRIYDCGIATDGGIFVVMEKLQGIDLDDLVMYHGPQPASRVVHWLIQACASLSEAHGLGLVHRDIKPANLFNATLGGVHDHLKVLDFGLVWAKPHSELAASKRLTSPGFTNGTPEYMAPEQAKGGEVDGRTDIYALGCVGWWLLTGQVVYERGSKMDTMLAHVNDPIPDIRRVNPDIPNDLAMAIHCCLVKDPAGRYGDTAAFSSALQACDVAAWTAADARHAPHDRPS